MNVRFPVTSAAAGPVGVFDSGYGGLTILREVRRVLPEYDYLYLGDNARAPYGSRSFDVVYKFTREAVIKLFSMGCSLVVLACNTASAKALRTIQQKDLPLLAPGRRVLGVIRPTAECVGSITKTRHIGILATEGTIRSRSYEMEIAKLWPDVAVSGVACPLWAAIVEAGEASSAGAEYFVNMRITQLMAKDKLIDSIILGCTHYPLLMPLIRRHTPFGVNIIPQGKYVAESLKAYMAKHPEIDARCTRHGTCRYLTTESPALFKETARVFLNEDIRVENVDLEA